MNPQNQLRSDSMLGMIPKLASFLLTGVGVLVIVGWALDIAPLKSVSSGWATMKVNTAACFVIAGICIWLLRVNPLSGLGKHAFRFLGWAILLVAGLTLLQTLSGTSFGIDEWLIDQPLGESESGFAGRMSPATAFSFLLLGVALLGLDSKSTRIHRAALVLAVLAGAIGLIGIAGYSYGNRSLYTFLPFSSMAAHTATLFVVACLGVLFARPYEGSFGILTASGIGSTMARRLLPIAIILPVLMGWLRLAGENAGIYGEELGVALFATVNVVIFALLIWLAAASLNRADAKRNRAEESMLRFRMAVESSPDGIFLMDFETCRHLDMNETACRMLGYSREELLALRSVDISPDISLADQRRRFEEARAMGSGRVMMESEGRYMRRKDGTVFPIEIARRYLRIGDKEMIVAVTRDISERERAEHALKAERTLLRTLVDTLPDPVFTKDIDGRFTMCNAAGLLRVGIGRESDIIGKTVFDIHPPEKAQAYHAEDLEVLAGEPLMNKEDVVVDGEGRQRCFLANKVPMRDHSGEIIGIVGTGRDVTIRRDQERRISRLNRIYAVLSGINSAIVRIHDRDMLFREACKIVVEQGRFTLGWIARLDHSSGRLVVAAQAGLSEDPKRDAPLDTVGLVPSGVAEIALRERRAAFDNLLSHAAGESGDEHRSDTLGVREKAIAQGAKSVIVLPLIVAAETFGVLTLYAPEPDFFDEEELRLLNELAGDISFGLEYIAKEEKVNYLAYYDALTELPNRDLFVDRLTTRLAASAREESNAALILIDINRFRQVNETLGRQAGDLLLEEVAQRLGSNLRDRDLLARVGPDRFALAVFNIAGSTDAAHVLESTNRSSFEPSFSFGREELHIASTSGIAMFPVDGRSAEALFANAEAALRLAKNRNTSYLFYGPEMNARVAENLRLESRLRRAIANGELMLWYQPKVDLQTRKLTGLEALMRWRDPDHGLISPGRFIPVMEQTGMILDAGNWALSQIAEDCRLWTDSGINAPRIAVNVSPIQLLQKNFVDRMVGATDSTLDAGGALDLEITESVIMENVDSVIPKLQMIKGLGVNNYIDDFGTGYSSLAYIARLPIYSLKIDRSFIVGMTRNTESLVIVKSVISLAHALSLKVVAEGVEEEEQAAMLLDLGCDEMQGYLFSKPLPPQEMADLLRSM